MLDTLETWMNGLTEMDWGWWPFLFLRPNKDCEITDLHLLKMSLFYGLPIGILGYILTGSLLMILYGIGLFFLSYRFTFAYFWNRRARRLQNFSSPIEDVSIHPPAQPWLSIWIKPRGTIRSILDYNPEYGVIILAILSGIGRFLDQASERGLGDLMSLPWLLISALVIGCAGGLLALYLMGGVLKMTGSWLGGKAAVKEVRAAVAWASLPDLLLLVVFGILILAFGRNWFLSSYEWLDSRIVLLILFLMIPVGLSILFFRIFLTIKCVSEAHRFSSWKGTLAVLLGFLIIMVPVGFLIILT